MDFIPRHSNRQSSDRKGIKNCAIDLNVDFLTATQAAHVVNGILDHLLLFSGQIPSCFPVFRNLVNQSVKGQENENVNNGSTNSWNSHLYNKQVQAAKDTLDQIIAVKDSILNQFKKTDVSEVVIAFGPTIFTVKEAIVIKVPHPNRNHYCVNHESSNIKLVMQLMRTLATSSELTESFNNSGKPIKTFLLLRKPVAPIDELPQFQLMPGFQLPSKCKTTYLSVQFKQNIFLQSDNPPSDNCCKLMQICSDVEQMSLQENDLEQQMDVEGVIKDWFICSTSIKGFKHVEFRKKSIFT